MMIRKITMTGSQTLPSPRIDEADEDGFIGFEQLRQGLTMRLPAFPGTPGTKVYMVISNSYSIYADNAPVEDPVGDIVIPVPADAALDFAGERFVLQAIYDSSPIDISPEVTYRAGAESFAPSIDEAVEGVIPASVTTATVRIRPFENMAAGDRIRLYLLGSAPDASSTVVLEVEPDDVGKDVTFTVGIRAHRNGKLYLAYEVEQGTRIFTSPASIFRVMGRMGQVRPVYATGEDYVAPGKLPLTYEGEDGCVPVCVTLPDDAFASDRLVLFVLPSRGAAIFRRHFVGDTPAGEIRLCLPFDRMAKFSGSVVHIGCFLEYLSGSGATIATPISSYVIEYNG